MQRTPGEHFHRKVPQRQFPVRERELTARSKLPLFAQLPQRVQAHAKDEKLQLSPLFESHAYHGGCERQRPHADPQMVRAMHGHVPRGTSDEIQRLARDLPVPLVEPSIRRVQRDRDEIRQEHQCRERPEREPRQNPRRGVVEVVPAREYAEQRPARARDADVLPDDVRPARGRDDVLAPLALPRDDLPGGGRRRAARARGARGPRRRRREAPAARH